MENTKEERELRQTLIDITGRYIDNSKEYNDCVDELIVVYDEYSARLKEEIKLLEEVVKHATQLASGAYSAGDARLYLAQSALKKFRETNK